MLKLSILFGLAALVAAPALADVTLRYSVKGQAERQIVLAAADDGRARLDSGEGAVLITRDGIGYFVTRDPQGDYVGRQEDAIAIMTAFLAAIMEMIPPEQQGQMAGFRAMAAAPYDVRPGARETVGGREGLVHTIGPAGGGQGPTIEIVLATDADLQPVGRELRRLLALAHGPAASLLGQTPDLLLELGALLERGVPIRIGRHFTLASVNTEPIPASAFELPGPVLSREELQGRMASMSMRPPPPATPELAPDADDEPDSR